jgi:hypothetical protein
MAFAASHCPMPPSWCEFFPIFAVPCLSPFLPSIHPPFQPSIHPVVRAAHPLNSMCFVNHSHCSIPCEKLTYSECTDLKSALSRSEKHVILVSRKPYQDTDLYHHLQNAPHTRLVTSCPPLHPATATTTVQFSLCSLP